VFDKVNGKDFPTCSYELLQALAKECDVDVLQYSPRRKRYAVTWSGETPDSNDRVTFPMTGRVCHAYLRNKLKGGNLNG